MRRFWSWLADLADQLEELLVDWLDGIAESNRRRAAGPCLSWFDTDVCELWAGHNGNHRGGLRIWMDLGTGIAFPFPQSITGAGSGEPLPELLDDIRFGDVNPDDEPDLSQFLTPPSQSGWPESSGGPEFE